MAEDRLAELAESHGKAVSIDLFSQKVQPRTCAISRTNLLFTKAKGLRRRT